MKSRTRVLVCMLILPLVLIASCKKETSNPLKDLLPFLQPCTAPDCVGTTDITNTPFIDTPADTGPFTYSLTIPGGQTSEAVYFIFTNPTTSGSLPFPSVTPNFAMAPLANSVTAVDSETARNIPDDVLLRDHPDRPIFVAPPKGVPVIQSLLAPGMVAGLTPPDNRTEATVGQTRTFNVDYGTVQTTCRYVRSGIATANGPRTLNIWVADDQWDVTDSVDGKIHDAMMQPIADRFLKTGAATDNDIYDWDTAIFGAEQDGTDLSAQKIIPFSPEINILLYDIRMSGVLGYFYAVDFFTTSEYSWSN